MLNKWVPFLPQLSQRRMETEQLKAKEPLNGRHWVTGAWVPHFPLGSTAFPTPVGQSMNIY